METQTYKNQLEALLTELTEELKSVGINDPHKYIRYKYGNEKIKNKNIE